MNIATQNRLAPSARGPSKACGNCGSATRENKPFCPNHVTEHDYVKSLLEQLETQRKERQKVERLLEGRKVTANGVRVFEFSDVINIDGITSQEILTNLTLGGKKTLHRLARDLNVGYAVVEQYVEILVAVGKISKGRTNRGSVTVRIISG